MPKFKVTEKIQIDGGEPITVIFKDIVEAETADDACDIVENDYDLIGDDFDGYPKDTDDLDIAWLHQYDAEEVI